MRKLFTEIASRVVMAGQDPYMFSFPGGTYQSLSSIGRIIRRQ